MTTQPFVGHQTVLDWMGHEVLTLADLMPDAPRVVVIGINPAPTSVAAGHYYQGRLGQMFFARLRKVGVLPEAPGAWEDDAAVAAGFGFTDIVKRPTSNATEVRAEEYAFGLPRLLDRLEEAAPPLTLFTFKRSAEAVLGLFSGCGPLDQRLAGSQVFVMPGPYAAREATERDLAVLRTLLGRP